jgi:N-acetyl sugar amidotransferase
MSNVIFCKRCVSPSTRPNGYFDEEGVCRVCRYFEQIGRGEIDWATRSAEINAIGQWGRERSTNDYDCIVTVSGGKDSMRQAFFVRDELGLNPLLVSSLYPPEQLQDRGSENLSNLIEHGFDTITVGLDPQTWKRLMRHCFFAYFNILRASELALYAIPIHAAIAHQIPLVFLGENPALTIGEKHGRLDGDASQMRHANTLQGGSADVFLDIAKAQELYFYNYPPDEDRLQAELRLVYLGYYIEDWSGWNNAQFAIARGLKIRTDSPENIGDLWGWSGVDEEFRLVNMFMKHVKLGFGAVGDQCMERIHSGEMTRQEAIGLIEKFEGKCHDKYIRMLCNYLEISKEEFWNTLERFRNSDIWTWDSANKWSLNREY